VVVTATDTISKLAANQKIKYKWSVTETCGEDEFTEASLTPTQA
jgi:hypothetical protein